MKEQDEHQEGHERQIASQHAQSVYAEQGKRKHF